MAAERNQQMILREKSINGQRGVEYHHKQRSLRISESADSKWLSLYRQENTGVTILSFYPTIEGDDGGAYLHAPQTDAPEFYWPLAPKNKS